MGGREALRHRERRAIYQALRNGTVSRRMPTDSEREFFFKAIDHRDINVFGVRSLAPLVLDILYPMPSAHTQPGSDNVAFEKSISVLAYAAWRRRHATVKQLLIAGASPTLSERSPAGGLLDESSHNALVELLSNRNGDGLASAAAAYCVEQVVKLRAFAARDAALLGGPDALPACRKCGGRGATVCFDPCGCPVCEGCVWRTLLAGPGGASTVAARIAPTATRGELSCPCCGATPPLRGTPEGGPGAVAAVARGVAAASSPTRFPLSDWACECCCYANYGSRPLCRNCSAPRAPAGRPPPPSFCTDLAGAIAAATAATAPSADPAAAQTGWSADAAATETPSGASLAAAEGSPAQQAAAEAAESAGVGGKGVGAGAANEAAGCGADAAPTMRVRVEMRVDRRRALGQRLCFLLGCAPAAPAATPQSHLSIERLADEEEGEEEEEDREEGGARARARARGASPLAAVPSPAELQLVLDAAVLGEADEERLALKQSVRGDRVRAVGTLRPVTEDAESQPRWELVCESALLLRPLVMKPALCGKASAAAPPADAAPAAAGASAAAANDFMAFGPAAASSSSAAAASAGGGAPAPAVVAARKAKFRALPPREAAAQSMRALDAAQRREAAAGAAASGDTLKMDALVGLGVDLGGPLDEYGQTASFLAATHGHAGLLATLLGLHPHTKDAPAHGGATPASAAAAKGHAEALAVLSEAGADMDAPGSEGVAPLEYVLRRAQGWRRPPPPGARLVRLIDGGAPHPGAGACYIDHGVPEEVRPR